PQRVRRRARGAAQRGRVRPCPDARDRAIARRRLRHPDRTGGGPAMMSSFLAVFRKEVLHIRRNRGVRIVTRAMPVRQLLLFGFIDQTVHDVPTVVVDQDHSVYSRELLDQLRATKTFEIRQITTSPDAARSAIIRGNASVGIVIPPDYHDRRTRSQPAKIL